MEKLPVQVMGMVWYKAEDYDSIRRIMADGDNLPDAFSVWRTQAEAGEQKMKRLGYIVFRALIDPKSFPDWCRSRGLNIDSKARNLYAGMIAKELAMGRHSHGMGELH